MPDGVPVIGETWMLVTDGPKVRIVHSDRDETCVFYTAFPRAIYRYAYVDFIHRFKYVDLSAQRVLG